MGLSPYPNPADGGLLCGLLVCTIISISIVRDLILSILHVAGIRIRSWEGSRSDFYECFGCPSENCMEEIHCRIPGIRFKSICKGQQPIEQDCSVCLTEFKPDAEINHLSCGHLFHKTCLEKWLRYWNFTCPLCRTRIVPPEAELDAFFW
ncbi:probable E3 ubiquitin-protein ligase XERICO [Diospyros lotus]|uniref:probable E3 ubiquitin-protein ligase XERICO n=1 Tax=Diospyros lotus TaxID=55363 RepID=UPI0022515E94|nr:probable E3 ubiquitin-protein ligase XERICO [Diospyros lotus]